MTPSAATMSLPAAKDVELAVRGQRALAAYLSTQVDTQHIQIFDAQNRAHEVELPTSALRLLVEILAELVGEFGQYLCLLVEILAELADGNAVKVVPVHAELTTQEAADLLNVSRPHFVKLLEDGVIPFHRAGKHRRVKFADLMQYKTEREQASTEAMADLARQSQELGLGYE